MQSSENDPMTYRRWCGLCGTYVYAGDKAPCGGVGRTVNACPLSEPGDVEFVPNKEALKARQDAEDRANREALMVAQRQFHQEPYKAPAPEAPVNPAPNAVELSTVGYPDDNPKTRFGVTKPSMSCVPPGALIHLMRAMADGKRKYGAMNWRDKPVSSSIYYDAALRHILAWFDGEEVASDSGVHHLGHAMACLGIILDAEACGSLNDDRPTEGRFSELVAEFTTKAA